MAKTELTATIGLIALGLVILLFAPTILTILSNSAMIWLILIIIFVWFLTRKR